MPLSSQLLKFDMPVVTVNESIKSNKALQPLDYFIDVKR